MDNTENKTAPHYADASDKALSRSYMAQTFAYYFFNTPKSETVDENNLESFDRPLSVNCAGNFVSSYPFTTYKPFGRQDYQLIYINAGRLTFYDGTKSLVAGAGSVIVLPAHVPYKYTNDGGDKLSYFWVHFTGSEASDRLNEYDLEPFPAIYDTLAGNHINQRFQSIFNAFARRGAHIDRELSSLMERLLITVARATIHNEKQSALSVSTRYIGANYSADITIPFLAEMEHLSVSRYNYLFKEQMGMPPTKFILSLRMSSARELLCSTDLPVKQIGIMCGYPDPHFFSKTFKSYFGVSPTDYRVGMKNE